MHLAQLQWKVFDWRIKFQEIEAKIRRTLIYFHRGYYGCTLGHHFCNLQFDLWRRSTKNIMHKLRCRSHHKFKKTFCVVANSWQAKFFYPMEVGDKQSHKSWPKNVNFHLKNASKSPNVKITNVKQSKVGHFQNAAKVPKNG